MSFADAESDAAFKYAETAILVGIEYKTGATSTSSMMAELERLVNTAGARVVSTVIQKVDSISPKTFIGTGKAEEISSLCRTLDVDVVVFDDELTPSQQSNLEKIMPHNVKVIDRTALILDIFALHATTKEGRLQVRLAQNQYLYPRLRGMWAHLASNRMGGGVGSRFGEGESQLEVDRRMVRKRITSIKRELKQVEQMRQTQRGARYSSGVFRIALAGYTNAGKSSLLNRLTNANVLSMDELFATLDSTTRKLSLPEGRKVTITDTVGFIQKLPTTLIEAFKSTLEEISNADLILHVVDASSDDMERQMEAVQETLGQIGAEHISQVTVFNKIDLLDEGQRAVLKRKYPGASQVSSLTGEGVDGLIGHIVKAITASEQVMNLVVPYERGDVVSSLHSDCTLLSESYAEDGTHINVRVPRGMVGLYEQYQVED